MVQSFMSPQHRRILQAHFNGWNLMIRKSQLYGLTKKDNTVINLFLQQQMNKPVGMWYLFLLLSANSRRYLRIFLYRKKNHVVTCTVEAVLQGTYTCCMNTCVFACSQFLHVHWYSLLIPQIWYCDTRKFHWCLVCLISFPHCYIEINKAKNQTVHQNQK